MVYFLARGSGAWWATAGQRQQTLAGAVDGAAGRIRVDADRQRARARAGAKRLNEMRRRDFGCRITPRTNFFSVTFTSETGYQTQKRHASVARLPDATHRQ